MNRPPARPLPSSQLGGVSRDYPDAEESKNNGTPPSTPLADNSGIRLPSIKCASGERKGGRRNSRDLRRIEPLSPQGSGRKMSSSRGGNEYAYDNPSSNFSTGSNGSRVYDGPPSNFSTGSNGSKGSRANDNPPSNFSTGSGSRVYESHGPSSNYSNKSSGSNKSSNKGGYE